MNTDGSMTTEERIAFIEGMLSAIGKEELPHQRFLDSDFGLKVKEELEKLKSEL